MLVERVVIATIREARVGIVSWERSLPKEEAEVGLLGTLAVPKFRGVKEGLAVGVVLILVQGGLVMVPPARKVEMAEMVLGIIVITGSMVELAVAVQMGMGRMELPAQVGLGVRVRPARSPGCRYPTLAVAVAEQEVMAAVPLAALEVAETAVGALLALLALPTLVVVVVVVVRHQATSLVLAEQVAPALSLSATRAKRLVRVVRSRTEPDRLLVTPSTPTPQREIIRSTSPVSISTNASASSSPRRSPATGIWNTQVRDA